ncbi:hypothetical protein N431DRAFT_395907 [Stipitochalara longipes BDJ]|nr:hypothetical protein N431DRAFT_395907 [Stipitochalara longipes BDJ]
MSLVIRNSRVVDDHGNYQDRILMKITAGVELLETQDLGQLVTYCQDFDPTTGKERPVDIVVKSPFMAMRYPKTINTARRIQVKFHNDIDLKRTLKAMTDLGLRITYKDGSSPAVPPSIYPVASLASSSTVLGGNVFADSLHRPSSAFTVSSVTMGGDTPMKPEFSSSQVKSDFKVPLRPDTAFSDHGQANHIPYSTPFVINPSSSTVASNTAPCQPWSKIDSFSPILSHQHGSLYVSQIEKESQNQRISQPILPSPSFGNIGSHAPTSLYISQMQSQRDEALERAAATSRLLSASPFFSSAKNLELPGGEGSPSIHIQRPTSTPIEHSDAFKMWIPPKRELPFSKPRKPSKPKPSSTPDLPSILPKPFHDARTESLLQGPEAHASVDISSTPVKKPAPKKRVAQRKSTTKPAAEKVLNEEASVNEITQESIPRLASIREESEELSPLAAKSAAASFRPASAPGLISKAILPPKKRQTPPSRPASTSKRPKMVDVATQTPAPSRPIPSEGAALNSTPDLAADASSPVSPPESYLNELNAFIAKHNPQPKSKELWQQPRYVEADEAHRQSMLNDFICDNLENPDFLQLCQDAEFAWRRIGLGM